MGKWAFRLLFGALILPLGGCLSFSNDVVDKPMANDDRLIGHWEAAGDSPAGFLTIAADSPTSLSITLYKDATCSESDRFTAVRTRIKDRNMLDVAATGSDGTLTRFGPFAYEFSAPGQLAIFGPDDDAFAHAVEAKELAGKIIEPPQDKQSRSIRVEASTKELRRWIAAHPSAMRDKPVEFTRRDGPSAPHCE
jgi:hypothetical protein